MSTITSNPDGTVHEGRSGIDGSYDKVVLHGFREIGAEETELHVDLQLVVGSIVAVFNPLSCASLAAILGMKRSGVWTALSPLHSIFIVPDSEFKPIRICHKSLPGYLQDNSRCTDARFYINPSVLNLELGLHCPCLRLMNTSLKKRICGLPRYAMNADISDLDTRREKYVGDALQYGCRSWAKYLRLASRDGDSARYVDQPLCDFFWSPPPAMARDAEHSG
jgi:hypothetical protein